MIKELRPGFEFGPYHLLEQIGVGGQGVVWSAVDRTRNVIVAIKFNETSDTQQQVDDLMFEKQSDQLLSVRHPHILPVYDYGNREDVSFLVSPYLPGGSLADRLARGAPPLEDALRITTEITSALHYLHDRGIIHRDLKPSNILLNLKQHTYLADFGLARAVSTTTQDMHTGRGTPPYAPPEQHKRAMITPKSDIYSFGIMLFEIFTGRLPWGGEKMLGIQQLYSNIELPDPCEINNHLPPLMKDVLRRITSADPAQRPSSVTEVLKMINYIFNISDIPISNADEIGSHQDAQAILAEGLSRWEPESGKPILGLTRFALLDHEQAGGDQALSREAGRFMLFHALTYGHHDDLWWTRVTNSQDRLSVSSALLNGGNEVIAARVLAYMVRDPESRAGLRQGSAQIASSFLEMAARSTNPALSRQLLAGLKILIPPATRWNDSNLPQEQNKLLGKLAMEDSDLGDEAACLIGHLHSTPAVDFLLQNASPNRLVPALLDVRDAAGTLPSSVRGSVRSKVTLEWIIQRLTAQPARLMGVYALALLGSTLGIASQVYLTYRLPEFMDAARISSSLEQGLIIGTLFSLGILITRVIVERFHGASAALRVLFGTLAGATVMNIALFVFHVLFLNTPPQGLLITLGCLLIASSYALGGLLRQSGIKMALSIGAIFAAIAGGWGLYLMAGSSSGWTPLFIYEFTWPLTSVLLTAFTVSAFIGIFSNLSPVNIRGN